MTETTVLFLIGQALVILAGVLASHVSQKTQIAELRGMLTQGLRHIDSLRSDHKFLAGKVDGISRHVAIIEGMEMEKAKQGGLGKGSTSAT